MNEQRYSLSKVLSRTDVLALAFGTMIGWGWVMLAGYWVAGAGIVGAMLAFTLGTTMCILVGLTYAELTPALPLAGGEMVFAYRGMGYKWGWVTAWAICLAYLGVAAWEGIAISTAINYLYPLPETAYLWTVAGYDVYFSWAVVGVIFAIALHYLNYIGTKPSAIFQIMATTGLLLSGIAFFFGSVAFGNTAYMVPVFTGGAGMISVLLMAPAMFVGFDVIPQSAEEMKIPLNQIAGILVLSIMMAAVWYMIMIVGIGMAAPPAVREAASVPVADAMTYAYGSPVFGKMLIVGAMCGILSSWNGFIVGGTRVLFAMGRAKMLPQIFGSLHPTYKTPSAAIALSGAICCLAPFLGRNALVWFVNASAFGTVVAYFMVSISFMMIRKKEPNLERPFNVKKGKLMGILAVITSGLFITLYLPIGPGSLAWPHEWMMIFGWALIGFVLALWAQKSYPEVSDHDREYLIFGEKYARTNLKSDALVMEGSKPKTDPGGP